jgi:nonribosomal peptide synthetase VibF
MDSQTVPPVATDSIFDAVLTAYRQTLNNAEMTAEDDFFEFGGDSVMVMKATDLISEMTGVEIGLGLFFTYPTAAELAAAILATGTD